LGSTPPTIAVGALLVLLQTKININPTVLVLSAAAIGVLALD